MLRKFLTKKPFRFLSSNFSQNIIGIDLGTSYTTVAIVEAGQARIVENNEGFRATPCVVAFNKDNQILVGSAAKRQAITHAGNTFSGIRNLVGRKFDDPIIQDFTGPDRPKPSKNEKGDPIFTTSTNQIVTPTEILSHLFVKVKQGAEGSLDAKITEAVVSVPGYFNGLQKQAIKDAAELAGLKVLYLVSEPVAACLAYGLSAKNEGTAFVYDMGGDSFDSAIVKIKDGTFELQTVNREKYVGGHDIDTLLTELFLGEFKAQTNIDLSKDRSACQRIVEAAEKSKIELSTLIQSDVNLPYLTADESGPKHFSFILKRAKLESLIDPFLKKIFENCQETLKESGLQKTDIDEVLLVGGGCKMPVVRSMVESFFNRTTNKSLDPDEVIALGASIQATVLKGKIEEVELMEVLPLSIGIEVLGGLFVPLVKKGSTIPAIGKFSVAMASNYQTKAVLKFYMGERPMAKDNIFLGEFELNDLHPMKRELSEIEAKIEIGQSGDVKLSAKDKLTNNAFSFKGKFQLVISREEIDSILKKTEELEKQDEVNIERIKSKVEVDELVCKLETQIEEIQETFGKKEITSYLEILQKVKDILQKDDFKEFGNERVKLEAVLKEIGEKKNQKVNENQKSEPEEKEKKTE